MTNPEQRWCEHLIFIGKSWKLLQQKEVDEIREAGTSEFKFCPICGAKRPVQNDELDLIYKKHDHKYGSKESWWAAFKADLLAWRDKAVEEAISESVPSSNAIGEVYRNGYAAGRSDEKIVQEHEPSETEDSSSSGSEAKAEPKETLDTLLADHFCRGEYPAAEAVKDWIRERMPKKLDYSPFEAFRSGFNDCLTKVKENLGL